MDWQPFEEAIDELGWHYTHEDPELPEVTLTKVSIPNREDSSQQWQLLIVPSTQALAFMPGEEDDDEEGEDSAQKGYFGLEFYVPISKELQDTTTGDVLQMINLINCNTPLTGFYWNPLEKSLFFRYMWFYHAAMLEPTPIFFLLQVIQDLLQAYATSLKDLGAGKIQYSDVLDHWEKQFNTLTLLPPTE
jgi:hypothetical protein